MASPSNKKLQELLGIPATPEPATPPTDSKKALEELLGISKAAEAPVVEVPKTIPERAEESDLQSRIKNLEARRADFIRQRVQELTALEDPIMRGALTAEEAAVRADAEFTEQFLQPLTTQYGDIGDRTWGLFGLSPSGFIPPRELKPVGEVGAGAAVAGALAPQREVVAAGQAQAAQNLNAVVDWDGIASELAKQGIDEEAVSSEVVGLRAAFDHIRSLEPNKNPADIMQEVIEARNALPSALAGNEDVIRGEVRRGLEEPWRQTLWRQRVEGQVPDLSPTQMAYMTAQIDAVRASTAAAAEEQLQGATKRMFLLRDGSTIDPGDFDPDFDAAFVRQIDVPLTDEEIAAKGIAAANVRQPEVWWANPESKAAVLADPEAFYQTGLFETTTPFGESIETPVSWALRALMAIPNAFAGAVSEVLTNLPTEAVESNLQAERKKRREQDQPVFADSPVLYNIARNRGFAGEAMEASEILQEQGVLGPTGGAILTGAGFVADFLDPSLPAIGAAGTALKTGAQVTKATKALRGAAVAGEVVSRAARSGAAEFIDLWAPFNAGRSISTKIQPGDLRLALAADLTNSQSARQLAARLAEQGEDLASIKNTVRSRFGSNSYTRSLDALGEEAFNALDAGGRKYTVKNAGLKAGSREARLVDDVDAYLQELNKMANGESIGGQAVRAKNLARELGAVATVSPEVRSVLAAVDAAAGTGPKLPRYLRALKSKGLLNEVAGQHIFSASLSEIMDATPKMRGLNKVVQITPNTWAPAGSQKQILTYVKERTRAGALAQKLVDEGVPVVQVSTPRGVETFYDLSAHPALRQEYEEIFRQLQDFETLSGGRIELRRGGLETFSTSTPTGASSLVRTKDFRNVLDATIDLAAEGLQVADGAAIGSGVLRARDVKRLSVGRQVDLLEPLENRSFSQSVFKDAWRYVSGVFEPSQANLSTAQRQFFRRAKNEVSTMDTALRKDMVRFTRDAEYRAALGAPADLDVKSMTKEQILGYLTVKKVPAAVALQNGFSPSTAIEMFNMNSYEAMEQMQDALKWTAGRYLFAEGAKESLDLFGSRLVFSEKFLSADGQAALNALAEKYAYAMTSNPGSYVDSYQDFLTEWSAAIKDNPAYMSPQHRESQIRTLGDTAPNSLLLGTYYKIEADRIISKTLQDVFAADTSASKGIFGEAFDSSFRQELGTELPKLSTRALEPGGELAFNTEVWGALIQARLYELVENSIGWGETIRNFDDPELLRQSLENTVRAVNPMVTGADVPAAVGLHIERLMQDQNFVTAYSNLMVQADDVARSIARKNGFVEPSTLAGQVKDVEHQMLALKDMFRAGGDEVVTRALIGEDAFAEIQRAVTENGFEHIEDWFRETARINSSGAAKRISQADRLLRNINELRYTVLLGMRSRFHGVNAMTAPMIIYSTIGASPAASLGITGIKDGLSQTAAVKSAKTLAAQTGGPGAPAWNATAVIDAAGRRYTYGDIFENVIAGGGVRSAMSFEVSQAMIDDALRIVPENRRQAVLNATGSLARLTQYEDNFFRLNIAYAALMEGRSLEDATALARRSLYDYGDMTSAERYLAARVLIFYSFTRQMVVQTLRNISTPRGWIRIVNGLKTERGASQFAQGFYGHDEQSSIWMPDYTMSRPIWTRTTGASKDLYQIGPSFAPNEGIVFLATLLSAGPSELIIKQLHPNITAPLGLEAFTQSTKQIQPHHVAMLTAVPEGMALFEQFVGGRIEAVRAAPEDGAVNGYVYPLTEEQEIHYKRMLALGQFLGTSTFVRDMARTFGATDEPGLETGWERAAFAVGAQTPIKVERAEKQKARELQLRTAEVGKTVKEREDK